MNPDNKTLIASEEWFAFKQLGIPAIKARVDTGAATSSLHAFDIEEFERDGQTWVAFDIHPLQKDKKTTISCQAIAVGQRKVKSSSGHPEKRYVIEAEISYQDEAWNIEITLTNRDSMGYRMLLGRQAMNGRIIVDPSESFLLGNYSKEEIRNLYKDKQEY